LPTTPTNQLTASAPLIQFQDVPTSRVGIDPNSTIRLTLHDAVVMAVARNLGIEVSRFDVKTSEYNLFASRGAYDPSFDGQVSFQSSTFPVTQTFQGGGTDASISQKNLVYNFGFTRNLEHGGLVTSNFDNTRQTTSSLSSTLNPVYSPLLGVNFSQPLLRNFDFDATRR